MTRIIVFFLTIFIFAFLTVWLADNPGVVSIDFRSYKIDTSFAVLTGFTTLLIALSGGLVWLIGYLRRETPILGSNSAVKRQTRGLKLLNQSLVALSAGDHQLATKLITQAEVLLPPQPMVHLVAAEAASRSGNRDEAKSRYKELEKTEDGKLIGIRGLLGEARTNGQHSEALRLARIAFQENRKSPWVLKTLFALEISAGNWAEAEIALDKVAKEKLLDKLTVDRHKGAIIYARAMESSLQGDSSNAQKEFKQALKLRPEFAPAAVGLANIELKNGQKTKAEKLILKAWEIAPRPSLLTLFKDIDPHESKDDWRVRVQKLSARNPNNELSIQAIASASFDAGLVSEAREVIDKTIKGKRSSDTVRLALNIWRTQGETLTELEKELALATPVSTWRCEDCNNTEETWSILCNSCNGFDTFVWQDTAKDYPVYPIRNEDRAIALISDL